MLYKIYVTVVQMHSRSATNKFPDSAIAKHVSVGSKKMSYIVAYGLGPYFQQATVKEVIQGNSYFTALWWDCECSNEKVCGLVSALLVRGIKGNKSEVFSINSAWACQGRYSGTWDVENWGN